MGKQTFGVVVSLAALFFTATVARPETNFVSSATGNSAADEAVWARHVVEVYQQLQEQQQATNARSKPRARRPKPTLNAIPRCLKRS